MRSSFQAFALSIFIANIRRCKWQARQTHETLRRFNCLPRKYFLRDGAEHSKQAKNYVADNKQT
jgi:hypothetical protein